MSSIELQKSLAYQVARTWLNRHGGMSIGNESCVTQRLSPEIVAIHQTASLFSRFATIIHQFNIPASEVKLIFKYIFFENHLPPFEYRTPELRHRIHSIFIQRLQIVEVVKEVDSWKKNNIYEEALKFYKDEIERKKLCFCKMEQHFWDIGKQFESQDRISNRVSDKILSMKEKLKTTISPKKKMELERQVSDFSTQIQGTQKKIEGLAAQMKSKNVELERLTFLIRSYESTYKIMVGAFFWQF